MRKLFAVAFVLQAVWPAVPTVRAADPSAEEFGRLQSIYTNSLGAIESRHFEKAKARPTLFLQELEALGRGYQQKGDLKGVIAVRDERQRSQGELGLTLTDVADEPAELRALKTRYRDSSAELDSRKAKELADLNAAYLNRLTACQRQLTVQGKIDLAVSVQGEIDRVKALTAQTVTQPQTGGGNAEAPSRVAAEAPSRVAAAADSVAQKKPVVSDKKGARPVITKIGPNLGPVGQWVYVSGENFVKGETSVSVGNVSGIEGRLYNDKQLGFNVPEGAKGTTVITVTTPHGSASSIEKFTVGAPTGRPYADSISPSSGPVNQWVYVHGRNFVLDKTIVTVGGKTKITGHVYGPDSLAFNVPYGLSGDVSIEVETPAGTAVCPQKFRVNAE